MKNNNHYTLLTLLLLYGCLSNLYGQKIASRIETGKELVVEITPIGDAYTDHSKVFSIKIRKEYHRYFIELWKDSLIKRNELNQNELKEVVSFFENWKNERCKFIKCTLSYRLVKIKIGNFRKKFRSNSNYAQDIISE